MLEKLFTQYEGYCEIRLIKKRGVAFVEYETADQATFALQGKGSFFGCVTDRPERLPDDPGAGRGGV